MYVQFSRKLRISAFFPEDPSCLLLPPRSRARPAENLMATIAGALATRYNINTLLAKKMLNSADVEQWGKIRRTDSSAGDTMHASSSVSTCEDTRDATFVRVRQFTFSTN
jgi:hypothetical protein